MRDDQTPGRWGLGEAVGAFVLATILAALAAQAAAGGVGYQAGKGRSVPLAVTVAGLLGLWIGLLGGVAYASQARGSRSLAGDFGFRLRWPVDALVGAVVGVTCQVILVPLLYLPFEHADPSLRHRLEAPAKQDTSAVHGGWQIAVLLLFLAVGAPLVEELFFRGLLLRSLERRFGPVVAAVGSAAVFGLAHFELLQLPALVLFGIVLALLAERTGRLGPGLVAHAAFNGVTVLTLTLGK